MNNLKGFAFGILTSATFGLIPLFTLPLMAKGMQFDSILFYRFLFAALALAGIMAAKKRIFPRRQERYPGINIVRFFLYGLRHVPVLGIQFYVGGDRHNAAFHLSGIRNAYHAVVFPGKDILDYLDGDRFGNLRGGTSFDR